ncbi:zeta toxin family protein [Streptomyces sp. B21-106]|uniref:zeta toxin family protein n=1 Tax=Streptomyces sp. B21-106 TaxID=3039418 RepID=UPI002FF2F229
MTDPSTYFLTEEQLRARFDERVREFVFGGFEPQDEPTLVLLGGQPAAGKSQAMAATVQRHRGKVVPLTGDELRVLHPRFQELLNEDAQTRETATAQASGPWVRMSIEYARDNGYGLLLEGVFRDPAMTIGTAEEFALAGRPVEVVALAVREERSRLDALDRFLEGGRWTPPDLQDLAYRMTPETVAAARTNPAVTRILITNRSGAELHLSERRPDGRWGGDLDPVQALLDERALPLPPDEAAQWLARHRTVVVEMAARAETNDVSRPVLRRLALDAATIAAMVSVDPTHPARLEHRAAAPLLAALVEAPSRPGSAPPAEFLEGLPATAAGREEAARRARLSPSEASVESELRTTFGEARRRAGGPAQAASPRRPDPGAARARSTTVRKPGREQNSPSPPNAQLPHLRRPGPDQGRGRSR